MIATDTFLAPESENSEWTVTRALRSLRGEHRYRFPIFGGCTGARLTGVDEQYAITWNSSRAQFFELPVGGTARMWPAEVATNVVIFSKKEQCFALRNHLIDKYGIKKFKVYRGLFPSGLGGGVGFLSAYFVEAFEDLLYKFILCGGSDSETTAVPALSSLYDAFSYEVTDPLDFFFFSRFGIPMYSGNENRNLIPLVKVLIENINSGEVDSSGNQNKVAVLEGTAGSPRLETYSDGTTLDLGGLEEASRRMKEIQADGKSGDVISDLPQPEINRSMKRGPLELDLLERVTILLHTLFVVFVELFGDVLTPSGTSYDVTSQAENLFEQMGSRSASLFVVLTDALEAMSDFAENVFFSLVLPEVESLNGSGYLSVDFFCTKYAIEYGLQDRSPIVKEYFSRKISDFEPCLWELVYPLDGLPSERVGPNRIAVGVVKRPLEATLPGGFGFSMSDPYTLEVYDEALVL